MDNTVLSREVLIIFLLILLYLMYLHSTVTIEIGVYLKVQNCGAKKEPMDYCESKNQRQAISNNVLHE